MSYGFQSETRTMNNFYGYDNTGYGRPVPSAPPPPPSYMESQMNANYASSSTDYPSYIHGMNNVVSYSYNDKIQQRINSHYPSKYAAIQFVLLTLCGVALIGLNVAMLMYKPDMYVVPTGFVGGVFFLILASFTLIIIKKRSFNLYYTMHLFYQLELIFVTPFVLVISILAAAGIRCDKISGNTCSNYNLQLHVPVAVIGGFGALLCLIFLIVLLQKIGTMKYARCQVGPSN